MKKYLFYTLALVGCWLLPIGVHTLVSVFYEKTSLTPLYMGFHGDCLSIMCIIILTL